jgi:hypothetical protein
MGYWRERELSRTVGWSNESRRVYRYWVGGLKETADTGGRILEIDPCL